MWHDRSPSTPSIRCRRTRPRVSIRSERICFTVRWHVCARTVCPVSIVYQFELSTWSSSRSTHVLGSTWASETKTISGDTHANLISISTSLTISTSKQGISIYLSFFLLRSFHLLFSSIFITFDVCVYFYLQYFVYLYFLHIYYKHIELENHFLFVFYFTK